MKKYGTDKRFQPMVEQLNAELRKAHEEGLSIYCATNGLLVQLQEGELVHIGLAINDCKHDFVRVYSSAEWYEGAQEPRILPQSFERCKVCAVTRPKDGKTFSKADAEAFSKRGEWPT